MKTPESQLFICTRLFIQDPAWRGSEVHGFVGKDLVLGICYFAMLHYSVENSLPVCSNYLQYDLLPGTGCLGQSIQHPHIANTLLRGQGQFRLSQNRIGEMFHHE